VPAVLVAAILAGGGAACSAEPEPSREALCEQLLRTEGLDEALATADAVALSIQADAMRSAVDVAPPEIEPSVRVLADTLDVLVATVDTAGGDRRTALSEVLRGRQDQADTVSAAGNEVTRWTGANCGVDLATGGLVPTTPPPPPTADAEPPAP
jgi:hypothetical protein